MNLKDIFYCDGTVSIFGDFSPNGNALMPVSHSIVTGCLMIGLFVMFP